MNRQSDRWEAGDKKKKTKSDYFPRHTCAVKGLGRAISASRPNASCKLVDWDSGSILTTVIDLFLDVPVEITEYHHYRFFIWLTSRLYKSNNVFKLLHIFPLSRDLDNSPLRVDANGEVLGIWLRFDWGENSLPHNSFPGSSLFLRRSRLLPARSRLTATERRQNDQRTVKDMKNTHTNKKRNFSFW